jgi:hypothetical protein
MQPQPQVAPVLRPNWLPEDFAPARQPALRIVDPWEPAPVQRRTLNGTHVAPTTFRPELDSADRKPLARARERVPSSLVDPWDPCASGSPLARAVAPTSQRDPWEPATSAPLDLDGVDLVVELPVFDPLLRSPIWEPEVFERRRVPTPRLKAHWVTAMLAPRTARERAHLQRSFQLAFTEREDKAFFRKVFGLAADGVEGDDLLAAAQFKLAWDESPGLWFYRSSLFSAPVCGSPGRKAMTWPKALMISRFRNHCPSVEMISDEWIDDWMRLRVRDPGYWTLADYAGLRAQEDEFANHRELWGHDREQRVWEDGTPAPDIVLSETKVAIGSGVRAGNVPSALVERFMAWREEQASRGRIRPE